MLNTSRRLCVAAQRLWGGRSKDQRQNYVPVERGTVGRTLGLFFDSHGVRFYLARFTVDGKAVFVRCAESCLEITRARKRSETSA